MAAAATRCVAAAHHADMKKKKTQVELAPGASPRDTTRSPRDTRSPQRERMAGPMEPDAAEAAAEGATTAAAGSAESGGPSSAPKKSERRRSATMTTVLPPGRGCLRWQPQAYAFYNLPTVQWSVAGLIAGNFLCNMVEKQIDPKGEDCKHVFSWFELFFNVVFFIELVINMYGSWLCRFWKSGWNVFDFVVVTIGMCTTFKVPLPGPFKMLRMMRAFRVFRLFKRVPALNKIITALANAVPGVLNAFLILFIVMCIYAILAVDFYMEYGAGGSFINELGAVVELKTARNQDYGYEYWGCFGKSLYTMFQVLTGESWSEAIARPLIHSNETSTGIGSAFFFVSFIVINQIVLINVVVAVLLENFVPKESSPEDEEDEEEVEEAEDHPDHEAHAPSEKAEPAERRPTVRTDGADKVVEVVTTDVKQLREDLVFMKEKLRVLLEVVAANPPACASRKWADTAASPAPQGPRPGDLLDKPPPPPDCPAPEIMCSGLPGSVSSPLAAFDPAGFEGEARERLASEDELK